MAFGATGPPGSDGAAAGLVGEQVRSREQEFSFAGRVSAQSDLSGLIESGYLGEAQPGRQLPHLARANRLEERRQGRQGAGEGGQGLVELGQGAVRQILLFECADVCARNQPHNALMVGIGIDVDVNVDIDVDTAQVLEFLSGRSIHEIH